MKRNYKRSNNSDKNFKKFYKPGMTISEYANAIDSSYQSTRSWLIYNKPELYKELNNNYKSSLKISEDLFKKYYKPEMSMYRLAKILGTSPNNISRWIRINHPEIKINSVSRKVTVTIITEKIFKKYYKPGMNVNEFANIINVNYNTAYFWIINHKPDVLKDLVSERKPLIELNENLFQKYYKPEISMYKLSKLLGVNQPRLAKWVKLNHPEIKVNEKNNLRAGKITEKIFKKYYKPGMTSNEFSKFVKCHRFTAYRWLKKHHPEVVLKPGHH